MLGVEVNSMKHHAKKNKLNLIIYKTKTTIGAQHGLHPCLYLLVDA